MEQCYLVVMVDDVLVVVVKGIKIFKIKVGVFLVVDDVVRVWCI